MFKFLERLRDGVDIVRVENAEKCGTGVFAAV
jgi:hypothetical protein